MVDGAALRSLSSGVTLEIAELETPALLVDMERMERNLDRAAAYAGERKLRLRPHVKTHKSPRLAGEQLRRGAVGLTCATPFEAEVMAAGVTTGGEGDRRNDPRPPLDLLLAYPPVGSRRAARLTGLPANVNIIAALDSERALRDLAAAAAVSQREVGVYVEMDLGMHRVGVQDASSLVALARAASDDRWLHFAGMAFYPGHIRVSVEEQDRALGEVSERLDDAIASLERAGLKPPVVSGGSTPTIWRSHEIRGVTEIRPGTYIFNDRTTAEIGACSWDDCALTILATVVSTAVPGQAVVDAGTKSLGREPLRGTPGEGFGALFDRPEVTVRGMSEEHGLLDLSGTSWRPDVGETVRIVPNHVCIVVHLADDVYGVSGDRIVDHWGVEARGR
jgi:D-serine deaminase-like pyridoxal phosphate-dependent protein